MKGIGRPYPMRTPLQIKLTEMIIKLSKKENTTEEELTELQNILNDVQKHYELKKESKNNIYDSKIHDKLKNIDVDKDSSSTNPS